MYLQALAGLLVRRGGVSVWLVRAGERAEGGEGSRRAERAQGGQRLLNVMYVCVLQRRLGVRLGVLELCLPVQ